GPCRRDRDLVLQLGRDERGRCGEGNRRGLRQGADAGLPLLDGDEQGVADAHDQLRERQALPTATLTCRKAGREQLDFIVIKLNDVLISGYSIAGSTGDVDPEDQVSLAFVKLDYLFRETNDQGAITEFNGG